MPSYQAGVRGIVLAGAYHWGESPFERLLRGPLLPVAQMPLICYPLRWLRDGGVRDATVCANNATGAVRASLGGGTSLSMHLAYHEDRVPRGAAGCVRDAGILTDADTIVVVEGALIPSLSLANLLTAHHRSGAAATVVVDVDRRHNPITQERPRTPGGIYVFDRRVIAAIPATGFQDIKESLLERLYKAGEHVVAHEVPGVSPRVQSYETYTAVNRWLIARMVEQPELMEGYVPAGEGLRHHSAQVAAGARIVGPVLIGPGSLVRAGAVLVGPTTIGTDADVGCEALVSRSVLWNACTVGDGAMVDGCLLADGAVVERGEMLTGAVRMRSDDGRQSVSVLLPRTAPPTRSLAEAAMAASAAW